MKIFATDYLESMKEDLDGGKETGPGKPTKSQILTYGGMDAHPDQDSTTESSGMLIA